MPGLWEVGITFEKRVVWSGVDLFCREMTYMPSYSKKILCI